MKMKIFGSFVVGLQFLFVFDVISGASKIISTSLQRRLDKGPDEKQQITIRFKNYVSKIYTEVNKIHSKSSTSKMTQLRSALLANSKSSQKATIAFLKKTPNLRYKHFWITNSITIYDADAKLIDELKKIDDIAEIREMSKIFVDPPLDIKKAKKPSSSRKSNQAASWGVQKIGAPQVWEQGVTGEGIIVANVDSGVYGDHEILSGNFIGDYGWFDPSGNSTKTPADLHGHGTHTMGTIVGQNGYGIAPGSKWMACRMCGSSKHGCMEPDVLACAQFIACPTHYDGSNPDCSKAAHVVNNSWGLRDWEDWFLDVLKAWDAAGVIVVNSAGNQRNCKRLSQNVAFISSQIVVGGTDENDAVAKFSSRGPLNDSDVILPDLCAPAVGIMSAQPPHKAESEYNLQSGTSVAAPHVTGAVALLMSAFPELIRNRDKVAEALFAGLDTEGLKSGGKKCGGIPETVIPNYGHGRGRLNVWKAYQYLKEKNGGSKTDE